MSGDGSMTLNRTDESARSVWVLIVFIATSAAVLALGAAVLGPLFIGWYSEAARPAWGGACPLIGVPFISEETAPVSIW